MPSNKDFYVRQLKRSKSTTTIGFKINNDELVELDKWCAEAGVSRSQMVRAAFLEGLRASGGYGALIQSFNYEAMDNRTLRGEKRVDK